MPTPIGTFRFADPPMVAPKPAPIARKPVVLMHGKPAVKSPSVAQTAAKIAAVVAPKKPVAAPAGGASLTSLVATVLATAPNKKPPAVAALYADARNTDPHSMLTSTAARTVLSSNQHLTPRALATAIQSLGISTDVAGAAAEMYALNGNRIPAGYASYYDFAQAVYQNSSIAAGHVLAPLPHSPGRPTAPPAMKLPTRTDANLLPAAPYHLMTPAQQQAVRNADISPVGVPAAVQAAVVPGMVSPMPGDTASPSLYYGGGGSTTTLAPSAPTTTNPLLWVAGAAVAFLLLRGK